MRLWVLGSGSKGNALLLECGDTRVLVDAGFSARRLAERLAQIRVAPESICALVVTHEHSDHVSGVATALKRWRWPVYASAGTLRAIGLSADAATPVMPVTPGATFSVGALELRTVQTSHDAAEPMGVVATSVHTGARAAVVTDLGVVTSEVRDAVRDVDTLVIESNHDEMMLQAGPYPYHLKRRVGGQWGHLSNRAAGAFVAECMHRGLRQLVLAHLSETNNTPAVALDTMQGTLRRARFRGSVVAAPQHGVVGPFGDAASVGGQLALAL